jgi:type IV secretory pathway VirB4 component
VDKAYYSGLIIVDYYREYSDIILKNIISSNINMSLSIFYEKLNTYKTIKDLTYFIGNTGVNLKDGSENREDIDIAAFSYNDAKYIRKEMQINNQDLYYLYMYIDVFAESEKELEYLLNKVEGVLQSNGISSKRANFRQEQVFMACLPIMENTKEIRNSSKRNVLTDGLVSTYPFISNNIFDENGIALGINRYTQDMIVIDRFNEIKYKNANMCIFGTSGAGKSFFTKLMILRYRMIGIDQYVIDPEREYVKLCDNLDGILIKIGPSSGTFVNVLDIREESIEEASGYLQTKLGKLKGFFKLALGDIDEEEWSILENILIEVYKDKGITFEDSSLYINNNEKFNIKPKFKSEKEMPILQDVYEKLKEYDESKKMFIKLRPFINGSLSFFNNYTNVTLENKLIVADIYELGEENIKYGMYIFTELFWDKVKKDRSIKKCIYMDEIWRLIGITSNRDVASFIYKIFKTIRKYGGSSVAITQDISDIFSLDEGNFGKSILNNSMMKCFFSLEEENIITLEKFVNLSEKERIELKSLKKGENLMFVGDNHIISKVEAAVEEIEIIEGGN